MNVSSADTRALVRELRREHGVRWEFAGSGHILLTAPCGEQITIANTPGDPVKRRGRVRSWHRRLAAAAEAPSTREGRAG